MDEEPRIENYIIANPQSDHSTYLMGRLIAMEESLRRLAAGREITSRADTMLTRAWKNPAGFFRDISLAITLHEKKLGRQHRSLSRMRGMIDEIVVQMEDLALIAKKSPLTTDQQALVALGYRQQRAYNMAYDAWCKGYKRDESVSTPNKESE